MFEHYEPKATDPSSLSYHVVRAILEDEEGALWVATDWGLNRLNRAEGTFTRYMHNSDDPSSLSHNGVFALLTDRDGALWIGTRKGIGKLDSATGAFANHTIDPDDARGWSNQVMALEEDQGGNLWVGTSGGLHRLDRATGQFDHYRHDTGDPSSLSHDQVLAIHQDREGTLWIGTSSGLDRFDPETQTFSHYLVKDGLPNDMVYGILEERTTSTDQAGALWLSTNRGLSRFDPRAVTFRNLSVRDGLQSDEYNLGAYHQSPSGEMFFGGINGFNAFYPEMVRDNPYVPPMALVSLTQGGAELPVGQSLETLDAIKLSWPNSFFEFEFAALSYAQADENQYAYKLEGFDKEWIPVGTRRFGSYTNLSGGSYTLRIKGSNNDGVWNEEGVSLSVTVVPPFWQTWQFILMVGLVVVAGGLGGYELRMRSVRSRARALQVLVRERTYEIERRRQVAEGLREILVLLNSDRPLRESLNYIVRQAAQLTGAEQALLFGHRENGAQAALVAHSETPAALPAGEPAWVAESIKGSEPLIVPDLARYRAANPEVRLPASNGHRAMLGIPLVVGGEAYGGLILLYAEEQAFAEQDLELCFTLADQAVLAIANDQLREDAELAAAQSERTRLARDLHDAVTQTLFSASLIAEIVPGLYETDQEEGRQLLKELRQLSRGALAEMRTLLLELRPAALIEADLADLVGQLAETVIGRTGAEVEFRKERRCVLPPDVHVALYRIAQEALNNVVKHARATRVTVRLRCTAPDGVCRKGTDDRVDLSVADDGRGFDPSAVPQERLGLGIMRERAASVGAVLSVESSPGSGTVISVVWSQAEA